MHEQNIDKEIVQALEITFLEVDRDKFQAIANWREKMLETRAATPKYKAIKANDLLVFKCGEDRLERQVLNVYHYPSIEEMLAHLPLEEILPGITTVEDALAIYYGFPDYRENIAKFGIVAIEFNYPEE